VKRDTRLSRRSVIVLGAAAGVTAALPLRAQTVSGEKHGMSAFGDLKYPPNFPHFDYVNPNAPKGGAFSQVGSSGQFNQNLETFNTLNIYSQRNDGALGMELTFAPLMVRALDEPDAMYGLAASSVSFSEDGLVCRFKIRPEATFHDGSKLTAHDSAWTINTLRTIGHNLLKIILRDVENAEAKDDSTLVVRFIKGRGRETPLIVAGLPVLSRKSFDGKNFDEATLTAPLGSGPYRAGRLEPGRFIEYNRVANWWGDKLNVSRGLNNFDTLRYEFYRDRDVGFQGFTARNYLFREEFTSRIWATSYDFPAVRDGRVKKEILPDQTASGAQGWFINTRREKFSDKRVREALALTMDFPWMNKNLMYGSYDRTYSYFQNSEMAAQGKPSPEELELLEPFRGKIDDAVFGEVYMPPEADGSGSDRNLLRRAGQLLRDAGCEIKDGKRVTPKGEPITIEFLINTTSFEPHHSAIISNLRRLGIEANMRVVDPAQFQLRLQTFDFDITVQRFSTSSTPGESLRSYFSSEAAKAQGSRNLSGISDPAIDALVEKIVAAKTRESLTFACRALDRVLRANHYWIPQWNKGTHWIAYWDVFARPKEKPRYGRAIPETWWRARAD
jgi:microcin C transport system substrate-binding protein